MSLVGIARPAGRFSAAQPSRVALASSAVDLECAARGSRGSHGARPLRASRPERGMEILEFSLVLPLLLVLIVGIFDFGAAFNLRQKMTNAAREGARIVVSTPLTDQNCTSATPCSIVAAANAVVQYMNRAGASLSCVQPSSPTSTGPLQWTYACPNGAQLVINRAYTVASTSGGLLPATRVTLSYPVSWHLAFFLPGNSKGVTLTTEVTMANLVD